MSVTSVYNHLPLTHALFGVSDAGNNANIKTFQVITHQELVDRHNTVILVSATQSVFPNLFIFNKIKMK